VCGRLYTRTGSRRGEPVRTVEPAGRPGQHLGDGLDIGDPPMAAIWRQSRFGRRNRSTPAGGPTHLAIGIWDWLTIYIQD